MYSREQDLHTDSRRLPHATEITESSGRLIASGNVSGPIRSHYWWRGVLEDQTEYRVTMHTRAELVSAIVDRTNRDHPYELPCVVATPITAGNPAYLAWVGEETKA